MRYDLCTLDATGSMCRKPARTVRKVMGWSNSASSSTPIRQSMEHNAIVRAQEYNDFCFWIAFSWHKPYHRPHSAFKLVHLAFLVPHQFFVDLRYRAFQCRRPICRKADRHRAESVKIHFDAAACSPTLRQTDRRGKNRAGKPQKIE